MKLFIQLVDANAPAKKYVKILNMSLGDIRAHIRFVAYYRLYIEMADKIKEMQKSKKNANALEKIKINNRVRQLRTEYGPRLLRLRGLKHEI